MTVRQILLAYAVAIALFLGMDAVWLSTMTERLYRPALAQLMAPEVNWVAVALFYPGYLAGVLYFAVAPALAAGRAGVALRRGAWLGLMAYATYDLTNQATLKDWPWGLTAIDLAWGACVTGLSAWASAAVTLATSRSAKPAGGR